MSRERFGTWMSTVDLQQGYHISPRSTKTYASVATSRANLPCCDMLAVKQQKRWLMELSSWCALHYSHAQSCGIEEEVLPCLKEHMEKGLLARSQASSIAGERRRILGDQLGPRLYGLPAKKTFRGTVAIVHVKIGESWTPIAIGRYPQWPTYCQPNLV